MKTALAILCSLLLVWTNIFAAQAPAASEPRAVKACCHCGKPACCATNRSLPEPPPVSAAPVSSLQTQFSLSAPAALAWSLPPTEHHEPAFSILIPPPTSGTELCARHCAWLI